MAKAGSSSPKTAAVSHAGGGRERAKPSTPDTEPYALQFKYEHTLDEKEKDQYTLDTVQADIVAAIQKAAGYEASEIAASAKKRATEGKGVRSKRASVASARSESLRTQEVFHQYVPESEARVEASKGKRKATYQDSSFPFGPLENLRSGDASFTGDVRSWRVLDFTPPQDFSSSRHGEDNAFIASLKAADTMLEKTGIEIERRNSAVQESNEAFIKYHEKELEANLKKPESRKSFDSKYSLYHAPSADPHMPLASGSKGRGGSTAPPSSHNGSDHSDSDGSNVSIPMPPPDLFEPGEIPSVKKPPIEKRAVKKVKTWLLGEDTKRAEEYEKLREKITTMVKKTLDHINHAGLIVITLNTQAMRALPKPYSTYVSVISNTLQIFWERFVTMPVDHKRSLFNWIKRCASQVELVVDALELATDNVELVESALRRPLLRVIVSCQQAAVGLQELAELPHFVKIFTRDDIRERVTELGLATNHAIAGFVAAVLLSSTSAMHNLGRQQQGNKQLADELIDKQEQLIKLIKRENRKFAQEEYDTMRAEIANKVIKEYDEKSKRQLYETQFDRTYEWFKNADVSQEAKRAAQQLHQRFGALAMIPEEDESKAPDLEDLKAATIDVEKLHEHIQMARDKLSTMDDSEARETEQVIEDVIWLRKELRKALEDTPNNTPVPSRHSSIAFGNLSQRHSKQYRVSVDFQSSLGLKSTMTNTEELGAKLNEQVNEKKRELLVLLGTIDKLETQKKILNKDKSFARFKEQEQLILRNKTASQILQGFKFTDWPAGSSQDLPCALWKPTLIEVGDVGYLHDDGHFEKCCNIWDFHWDKYDKFRFVGTSKEKYRKMVSDLPNAGNVIKSREYKGERWDRSRSLSVSASFKGMKKRYNEWIPEVYIRPGAPYADIRVKTSKRWAVEGSDLNGLMAWWREYHGVFEDMLLDELNEKGYSVKELILVPTTFNTHKYALIVSDLKAGEAVRRFKLIEQHDRKDKDDWCRLFDAQTGEPYNKEAHPHIRVNISKRQLKKREKQTGQYTVFIGKIYMEFLPRAGRWVAKCAS